MDLDKEIDEEEQIEARYKMGGVEVVITDHRVIVDENGELKSMMLHDITEVVLVKGDVYEQKEGPFDKFLQKLGVKDKPDYPIKVKFKAALPTARRMHFMTNTNYEEAVEDFHTEINLKV